MINSRNIGSEKTVRMVSKMPAVRLFDAIGAKMSKTSEGLRTVETGPCRRRRGIGAHDWCGNYRTSRTGVLHAARTFVATDPSTRLATHP